MVRLNKVLSCFSNVCLSVLMCAWWAPSMCVSLLSTCEILRIHSLPLGRESSVCEATVRLEGDRYCVSGADHHWGKDVAAVRAWKCGGDEES